MAMHRLWVIALFLCAQSSWGMALRFAPVPRAPFVPGYVSSLRLSLKQDAFYASRFMGAFNQHLDHIAPMQDPQAIAVYLQDEITATQARSTLDDVAAKLGQDVLAARTASAVLLANALVRPDQAETVLVEMEKMVPAWGQQAAHSIDETGHWPGIAPGFARILNSTARAVRPAPHNVTYNSRGKLNGLFDGSR
jgi:hypothetical protein